MSMIRWQIWELPDKAALVEMFKQIIANHSETNGKKRMVSAKQIKYREMNQIENLKLKA